MNKDSGAARCGSSHVGQAGQGDEPPAKGTTATGKAEPRADDGKPTGQAGTGQSDATGAAK